MKTYKHFQNNDAPDMQIHVRKSVQWTVPTQVLHILLPYTLSMRPLTVDILF